MTDDSHGPTSEPTTSPDAATQQRDAEAVLADAIAVLTEAGRLRRPVLERVVDETGAEVWRPHPTKTEQGDWAELVTLAITAAAANLGGVETALAGRPGSWEADKVRSIILSTAGDDPAELMTHRREPLRVRIAAAGLLQDLMDTETLFDESHQVLSSELDDALQRIEAEFDASGYVWTYRVEHRQGEPTFVPLELGAPAFDEARWRDDVAAHGVSAENVDAIAASLRDPSGMTTQVSVSRDDASRAAMVQLEAQAATAAAPYEQRLQDLEDLQERERVEYAQRLRAAVEEELAGRYPHLEVVVDVDLDRYADVELRDFDGYETPEEQLLQHAIDHTPLPGSGLTPRDYPPGPIGDHERAAGRLPHTRMSPYGGAEQA